MTLKVQLTEKVRAALNKFAADFNTRWHGNDNPDVRAAVMSEDSWNQELFQAGFEAGKADKLGDIQINVSLSDGQVYALTSKQLVELLQELSNERNKAQQEATDLLDTLDAVLGKIGYTEEYAEQYPDEKVSVTVKRFIDEHYTRK